jgi:conjugal transfer/entry exclusion protein
MAFDDSKIKQANEELEQRLIKDRIDWKNKIIDLVAQIKIMRNLSDCQVNMLSYRQMLLDKMGELKNTIYKRNAAWERYYKVEYREYSVSYDLKLTSGEKHQFIRADLSLLKNQIEMLQGHVEYYQECIRTLDNMAFAIRNRIRLEDEE